MNWDHGNETTPMVYTDHTGQIVIQTKIPSNLQANTEQVRPAPEK